MSTLRVIAESSLAYVMQLMFVAWAGVVLVMWVVASMQKVEGQGLQLAEIPPSVISLLGLLLTGKVAQAVALAIVDRRQQTQAKEQ